MNIWLVKLVKNCLHVTTYALDNGNTLIGLQLVSFQWVMSPGRSVQVGSQPKQMAIILDIQGIQSLRQWSAYPLSRAGGGGVDLFTRQSVTKCQTIV
jgi:hypothetical protein